MKDDLIDQWFPQPGEAGDPTQAARQAMKTPRPRRFYERAAAAPQDDGFALTLDDRPAHTPGRHRLVVPTEALGAAVAAEWQEQGAEIDPATMPLTRLCNSAIDGVAPRRAAVIADLVAYAGSDLVCYRADGPERLVAEQAAGWDPVLDWAHEALGARFVLSEGVMHVAQPDTAIAAVRSTLERETSPFALAALHVMTTLTGSVLIALAHAAGRLDAREAWAAAHIDERYQESVWGEDAEALARRAAREADFTAASRLYALGR